MNPAERATADKWFERYLDDVFRYVLQRVHGIEEARDITAEVFAAAAAGLPRFRGECPPYLWLLSIARKQIALARRRREARRETLASELPADGPGAETAWEALAEVEGPEAALMQSEARRVVRDLLAELSADQREAVPSIMRRADPQFDTSQLTPQPEQIVATDLDLIIAYIPGTINKHFIVQRGTNGNLIDPGL